MAWRSSIPLELTLLQPEGGKVLPFRLKSCYLSFMDLDFPPSVGIPFLRRVFIRPSEPVLQVFLFFCRIWSQESQTTPSKEPHWDSEACLVLPLRTLPFSLSRLPFSRGVYCRCKRFLTHYSKAS